MVDQQRVRVDGVTFAVKTWPGETGSGPALVLLPATGETADDWDVVAEAMAPNRTVHAVNLRGHGASDWPGTYSTDLFAADVAALVARLADGPVDLVGHSLGGLVAAKVAAAHPGLVRRLVLEEVGLLRPRTPVTPVRPDGDLPFDWAMVGQVRAEIDDPDPGWRTIVRSIRAPILLIAGGSRSTLPQEQVDDLARTARDARLLTLDTGHLVHDTAPADYVQALRDFLDPP